MGYTFHFGRAVLDRDEKFGSVHVTVEPPSFDPEVHSDAYEDRPFIGEPGRSPSYVKWAEVCRAVPSLGMAMDAGRAWVQEEIGYNGRSGSPIPVSVFEPFLERIEAEAEQNPEAFAVRALWFVRWARRVRELYGDWAYFDLPGEWVCP